MCTRLHLLVALLAAGCVTVRFDRRRAFEPVASEVLDGLRARGADLTECLATLGAPNLVWEQPDQALAIAYAWLDHFGWGLNVSVSFRGLSVSGDFDSDYRRMEGAVLFFDGQLRLIEVEQGLLRDFLRNPGRRPPAATDS